MTTGGAVTMAEHVWPRENVTITRALYEKLVAADGEAYGRGYRDGLRAGQSIERGVCAALHDNPYPV